LLVLLVGIFSTTARARRTAERTAAEFAEPESPLAVAA
jgi:hypothetical protein